MSWCQSWSVKNIKNKEKTRVEISDQKQWNLTTKKFMWNNVCGNILWNTSSKVIFLLSHKKVYIHMWKITSSQKSFYILVVGNFHWNSGSKLFNVAINLNNIKCWVLKWKRGKIFHFNVYKDKVPILKGTNLKVVI